MSQFYLWHSFFSFRINNKHIKNVNKNHIIKGEKIMENTTTLVNITPEQTTHMQELINTLNNASEAYYNGKDEVMSNYEWDALFDELTALEESTGVILPDSPTAKVGFNEESSKEEKIEHEYPALSLPKTKSEADLINWLEDKDGVLSFKLDGLTLVATYDDGKLTQLVTRGNGHIGTVITAKAPYITGIPLKIKETGHMVVRGEALISYEDFDRVNAEIENEDEKYANARNLASGTIGLDISRAVEIKERGVKFIAFTLVYSKQNFTSKYESMKFLRKQGFETVESIPVTKKNLSKNMEKFTKKVQDGYSYPVDGLVLNYEDLIYAASGTMTGHHINKAGIAFKWEDKPVETTLRSIEWSCAVANISPVAIFDPVEIEGTTVSRASLCNISEMERLGIGENGQTTLQVIKANMIIPKVIEAKKMTPASFSIPEKCPVCGASTEIHIGSSKGTKTLHCTNSSCPAKQLKKYERFASKQGMDIDGLSGATIESLINAGLVKNPMDLYTLQQHKETIVELPGFGEKSYDNMILAISKSIFTSFAHFVYALNIPMIGEGQSKLLEKAFKGNVKDFLNACYLQNDFTFIDGIGEKMDESVKLWSKENISKKWLHDLYELCDFKPYEESGTTLDGVTFVITGDVHIFVNRNEFKNYVEKNGGKVAGSVSAKTNYLVNNDTESMSAKNKKAKELGIEIISEEEFINRFGK